MAQENKNGAPEQQFAIQRFFVKDISFEAPSAPEIFVKDWQPEMNLEVNTENRLMDNSVYEVMLHLTVTVKSKQEVAFLAEVTQGGMFSIVSFPEKELKHTLGSFCPGILYPYARQVITDLVVWGGFPQLILAPINFDALYERQQEEQAKS